MTAPRPVPTPDCLGCRHFFVTWDPALPRGCRAFGLRCVELPARVVQRASGEPCQLFEARVRRPHQGSVAPE